MTRVPTRTAAGCAFLWTMALAANAAAGQPPAKPASTPPNELDAFMEKVLKRRDVNRQTLQQYVLDESEQIEFLGPARMPIFRQKREFAWYVRDGLHVRSPVRFDGVDVGEEDRKKYEDGWARRERARLERKEARKDGKGEPATQAAQEPSTADDPSVPTAASPVPTPRFVSEAYFMEFGFEPGNYYLAGREQLDGQQVLRIEYYPRQMFNIDDDDDDRNRKETTGTAPNESRDRRREKDRGPDRKSKREKEFEQRMERQMNKTALVTLWVDPAEHQIVKYTFDNVWMDFLPIGWLLKVDDIRASMTMGQPFPGVWLPREMDIHAGVTTAAGSLEAAYARRFTNYKQADVKTQIRIPKEDEPAPESFERQPFGAEQPQGSGPFVPGDDSQAEVIAEIRVHGNAYLRDDEVLKLAGVAVGQPLPADAEKAITARLEASGHFETIEVRKRYRSLDNTTDVALILLVHERDGFTSETLDERPPLFGWGRTKSKLMFLPILSYDDGYGFTYGGRLSTIDLFGGGERVSTPFTWGGTRRAAIEVDRTFNAGPLTRVESTFGIWQRENPHFEIDEQRVEWTARAERSVARVFRAGVDTSQSTVEFGALDDRLWTIGANVALDTRGDPTFPRNAVYAGAGWTGLHVKRLDQPINQYTTDVRGYLGVIRQAVLAGRAQYTTSDRTLPDYERLMLGGASNLRGFGTGTYIGDRLFATSAELRIPITSVLSGAKLGITAFMDAGKVWDAGQTMTNATWHRGVGGGVFLIATVVRLNLDVAHGLKDGDTRVHLSSGFSF